MSGEWKSHWPWRERRERDKMNKNINPLLQKIIPSLPPASVSEVTSSKSHNKSPHHKTWLERKGTSRQTMLNPSVLIMLSLKWILLQPESIKMCFLVTSLSSQIAQILWEFQAPHQPSEYKHWPTKRRWTLRTYLWCGQRHIELTFNPSTHVS